MTHPAIVVRDERAADVGTIHDVVAAAFEQPDEAVLVDALRAHGGVTCSLVAEAAGRVVGHVLFSPVTIVHDVDGDVLDSPACGLAPLAVLPEMQRRGVGDALARAGLARCRDAGFAVVVVLGSPVYYGRFGFVDATRHGLRCEYEAPPGAFQVLELRPGALSGRPALVRYRPEFAGF